jgi:hypothetical protein
MARMPMAAKCWTRGEAKPTSPGTEAYYPASDSAELMTSDPPSSSEKGRVLLWRPRRGAPRPPRPTPPIEDLTKYERSEEVDDYRHRMITNAIAFAFVILLVIAGIWIANKMAEIRKNQDCVLTGRRGCTPVDVPPGRN